jgi:hypothetical protein
MCLHILSGLHLEFEPFTLPAVEANAQRRQRGAFALSLEDFVSVPPANLDPAPVDAF